MTTTTVSNGAEFSRDYYDHVDHWCNDPEVFNFDLARKMYHENIEDIFDGICKSQDSTATLCLSTGEVIADIDDEIDLDFGEIVQDAAQAALACIELAATTGAFDIVDTQQRSTQ